MFWFPTTIANLPKHRTPERRNRLNGLEKLSRFLVIRGDRVFSDSGFGLTHSRVIYGVKKGEGSESVAICFDACPYVRVSLHASPSYSDP